MTKHIISIFLFSPVLFFGTLDRIQKAMGKKEYDKAYELLHKGFEKSPENSGFHYYYAKLFFDSAYAKYDVDTARISIENAKNTFENASEEVKKELISEGITQEKIASLYQAIQDQIFQNINHNLSVNSAKRFLRVYPNSPYEELLIFRIDSMDFRQARLVNTQQALLKFTEDHPTSSFRIQAEEMLDFMRVEELERSGNLTEYYNFLRQYPNTKHRARLESYILKVSTASHDAHKYHEFISYAETPFLKKRATDVLYYSTGRDHSHSLSDSLQSALELSPLALFPVISNDKFGFYDQFGKERIVARYAKIPNDYLCLLNEDDWVFIPDSIGFILNKNGELILNNIEDYRSVERDVALVKRSGGWFLYHKSGFQILEKPIADAEVLYNKWIRIKRGNKWGLISYMGLEIAETVYDNIDKIGDFWVFERNGLLAVYTEQLILNEVEEKGLSLEFKFDDIELVNDTMLIGFRKDRECLLDATLNFLIPWGVYEIYPEKSGWYLKSSKGYRLYNDAEADIMDQHYPYLESNNGWLAIQTNDDWMLLPRASGTSSRNYDSIKLLNDYAALLLKEGQKTIRFSSGREEVIKQQSIKTFPNKPAFLSVSDKYYNTKLYDQYGVPAIEGKFEELFFLNDTLVRVQVRGRQGVMNTNGDWVLNPLFNGIDEKEGLLVTLLKGKIGCFDPAVNKLIPAKYEARIERIGSNYRAKKNAKYGIIDAGNSQVISFAYDEIDQWNDSLYLVKEGDYFKIIDSEEKVLSEPMEKMKMVWENPEEQHKIYRFVREGKYGLVSTQSGELLDAEFTDIFNIGSADTPLFFADQHLDKAGFHVVSYIDQLGKLIHSRAYTASAFEQMLCDN